MQIIFDPTIVTYRTLIEFLYKTHDPTTLNRQGGDAGTQYRSAIFYHDEEQKKIAEDVTKLANENWWDNNIKTTIIGATDWWDAEKYHQRYLDNNPGGYECPTHYVRKFKPLPVSPVEEKPAEEKPAEAKPAEEKPAEIKPAEVKPAEEQS